jgi:2-C-methyl-D-erythritol 4-phosphate cytidylyltransferase
VISALIAAAGEGSRLRAGGPKALVPIAGRPMLCWSVDALARVVGVGEILVAAPPDAIEKFEALREAMGQALWRATLPGGRTRTESVGRLVDAAVGDRVLVHDAARPCVEPSWVRALLVELGAAPAGVPALPVRDTLKRGEGRSSGEGTRGGPPGPSADGEAGGLPGGSTGGLPGGSADGAHRFIAGTLSREGLFTVQTPQIFDAALLRRAHAHARERTLDATDDAALVEALGERVRLLAGDPANVKVTEPADVDLAEWILRGQTTRPAPSRGSA